MVYKYEITGELDKGSDATIYKGIQYIYDDIEKNTHSSHSNKNSIDIQKMFTYNYDDNNYIKKNDVAMKRFSYDDNNMIDPIILRELAVLTKSECPHVIKLLDVHCDDNYIYIVQELEGYNLLNNIINGDLTEDDKIKLSVHIIEAINYLHSMGYNHGDINFKNILYGKNKKGKIIDFCSSTKTHRKNIIYKPAIYVCPYELLNVITQNMNDNIDSEILTIKNTKAMDMWMLGCTLYFLITTIPLFLSDNLSIDNDSQKKVIEENICLKFYMNIQMDRPLELIKNTNYKHIKQLLTVNPNNRKDIRYMTTIYKHLYEQYGIECSENELFTFEHKYNKSVINVTSNIHIDMAYFLKKTVDFYKKKKGKINIESIFLATKNLSKLFDVSNNSTEVKSSIYKKLATCFWFSNKIVNKHTNENNIEFLKSLLHNFDIHEDAKHIRSYTFEIAKKIKWDFDPMTAFDYISDVTDKIKPYFVLTMFIIFMGYNNIYISELCKYIAVIFILHSTFKMNLSFLNKIVNKAIQSKHIDKTYITCNIVNILLYLQHYKEENMLSVIDDIFEDNYFGDETKKWFNKLNFKKLFNDVSKFMNETLTSY